MVCKRRRRRTLTGRIERRKERIRVALRNRLKQKQIALAKIKPEQDYFDNEKNGEFQVINEANAAIDEENVCHNVPKISEIKTKLDVQNFDETVAALKTDDDDPEYRTCHICDTKLQTYSSLCSHMQWKHRGIKAFKCEMCGFEYATKRGYHRHLRKCRDSHESLDERFCYICEKALRSSNSLRCHWYTQHKGSFRYKCKMCAQTFKFKKEFMNHIMKKNCSTADVEIKEEPPFDMEEFIDEPNIMDTENSSISGFTRLKNST